LGLAPFDEVYDSFVNSLFVSGVISEPTFAMGLRGFNDEADSFVDIGFTDAYSMATGKVGYVDVSSA